MAEMHLKPGESLQRKQTMFRRFTDNHGRILCAQCDARNNMPKEELRPENDGRHGTPYTPPWMPPMRFAIFTDGSDEVRWDYETMATELSGDAADYYQRALEFAIEHNKPEPELGGPVHASIRLLLGKPPLSPAIPLACAAGDPWLLGVPGAKVNPVLSEVLYQGSQSNSKMALELIRKALVTAQAKSGVEPVPQRPMAQRIDRDERPKTINDMDMEALGEISYKEFLAECRGRKMTLQEISKAWQEHKKNLAADEVTA